MALDFDKVNSYSRGLKEKTQPRDNTRINSKLEPRLKKKEEKELPDNRTYLSQAPSKDIREANNLNHTLKQIQDFGDKLKQVGLDLRDYAAVGTSMLNPAAGMVLGLGDAGISAAKGDYVSGGVQAGLEMLPGVGKGVKSVLSKNKNIGNIFNFRSYSDSAKKFVIEDAKDFKEIYNYLSNPQTQQRLQNIDKELGTNYEKVVREYLKAADSHPNKEVFINNADQSIRQGFASTNNEGSSWAIDNSYLSDPLNPSNYWMLVRSNRSPGTIGHEVKHLLEMMETASRLTKEDRLKILSGKAKIADYVNNSPRLKKLTENNTIDFDTWRNNIINNGGDDVTLKDYDYFKQGTEFNSQLHPIVLERIKQGKSGLFNYNNTKELFEDIDNAVKRENDHSLYYLENLVKDKGKLIEVLNKYGFVSIPAVIGANSIKNTNDGKR